jgi:Hemolysins and related proteins containing CBS domains
MDLRSLFNKFFSKPEEPNVRHVIEELITEEQHNDETTLHEQERQLFTNILHLRGLTAEDVMLPRADMICINVDASPEDVLATIEKHNFSRYPVFADKIDDIRGFIHIKDIAQQLRRNEFDARKALCQIIFVPTSLSVMDLLAKMRQFSAPIAIVIDEYGGTDGLVTAWDILSKIIGEMQPDQVFDESQPKLTEHEDGTYIVDARLPIHTLEQALEQTLTDEAMEEEADTVGGLVMYLAGRVPDRTEVIEHPEGYEFEVLEASPRTVHKVRVSKKVTS